MVHEKEKSASERREDRRNTWNRGGYEMVTRGARVTGAQLKYSTGQLNLGGTKKSNWIFLRAR